MRNFARINNYYNNLEAAKEYASIVEQCKTLGIETPILPNEIGWRKLDLIIASLKEKIAAATTQAKEDE